MLSIAKELKFYCIITSLSITIFLIIVHFEFVWPTLFPKVYARNIRSDSNFFKPSERAILITAFSHLFLPLLCIALIHFLPNVFLIFLYVLPTIAMYALYYAPPTISTILTLTPHIMPNVIGIVYFLYVRVKVEESRQRLSIILTRCSSIKMLTFFNLNRNVFDLTRKALRDVPINRLQIVRSTLDQVMRYVTIFRWKSQIFISQERFHRFDSKAW